MWHEGPGRLQKVLGGGLTTVSQHLCHKIYNTENSKDLQTRKHEVKGEALSALNKS